MIWGCSFVVNKMALQFVSPLLFNAVRLTLATVVLVVFYRRNLAQLTVPAFRAGAVVGFFLFLGYELQTTGLQLTTPSKSAFLTGISAVLVPVVLLVFWKTHIRPWRAAGIAAALAGLFLMAIPPGSRGIADFAHVNAGDLLTIGGAFAFAFQIVFLGRAAQRFPFEQMAVLQIGVAAVLMLPSAPLLEHPHLQPTPTLGMAILFTGIFSTAIAFSVQAWAQQFTPATHAALIFTLEPVFAWLASFVLFRERLGMRGGAGALLILAGVLVSELLGNVSLPDDKPPESGPSGASR
ncbi:MAG: DMT family transporter [Acidobacteriia bacterium]|nr:DMT family transporter [Terriglobia bacterium]